jgi:regulator of cell morphogenesis and NO signaling
MAPCNQARIWQKGLVAMPLISPKQSAASIVSAHPECAVVFQQFQIDFFSISTTSLDAVCSARNLATSDVIDELTCAIDEAEDRALPLPAKLSTLALLAHIVAKQHEPLRQALSRVSKLLLTATNSPAKPETSLSVLSKLVAELGAELLPHLEREEAVLFPMLVAASNEPAKLSAELSRAVAEHSKYVTLLQQLREASENYRLPDDVSGSYRELVTELIQIELETMQHLHLENCVLYPRFIA